MSGERSGTGKEKALGMAIHHSLPPWSSRHVFSETLAKKDGIRKEACHTQLGVTASRQEWRDVKRKRGRLVDFCAISAWHSLISPSNVQGEK